MTTLARRVDGGYVLTGQKTGSRTAAIADLYMVFAQTEPGSRSKGMTAFVLERGDAGLRFGRRCASSATAGSQHRAVPG